MCLCAPVLSAQQPPPPLPAPRAVPDSQRPPADTVLPDSLSPDSFRAELPRLGPPPGPMARSGRVVFDKEALVYSGALTLGELLQEIPGVFLVRAGWFGQPERAAYAGQGASSVELYWDGFALDPLGEDSTAIDLSRISLGLLKRVEVEVLPTVLRVYLISDTQLVRRPRTETSFATGDASTNSYRIRYLNRWRNGSGLGVGVTFYGTDGPATTPGSVSDLAIWAKGTWTPSDVVGVEYQLVRHSMDRDSLGSVLGGPGIAGVNAVRTDAFVRAHAGSRADGLGLRFDALLGSSSYSDSGSLERHLLQAGAALGFRGVRWSLDAITRVRDTRTPFEVWVRGGWAPLSSTSLSLSVFRKTHDLGRRSLEAAATAEVRPLRWLAVWGTVRARDAVASPEVAADTAQQVNDWRAGLTFSSRPATLDLSVERHGGFVAPAFAVFGRSIPNLTTIDVTTLTLSFSLRPWDWLTLAGWYRDPLDPMVSAFEPPTHTRAAVTFRSRFLRKFRRGEFDLVARVGVDAWGDGVAGSDSTGAPVRLGGGATVDYLVEFRLVGAVIFWTLRNSQAERYNAVPGFEMARALQRYGVRWEFTN